MLVSPKQYSGFGVSNANPNVRGFALQWNIGFTVSEIKGAPCTRRAHFHGRVHDFRRCAPGVSTFF